MARTKRYKHEFVDGELVTDIKFGETFPFNDLSDGFRAEKGHLRQANDAEKHAYHQRELNDASRGTPAPGAGTTGR